MPTAAPNTRSKPRCTCRTSNHVRNKKPFARQYLRHGRAVLVQSAQASTLEAINHTHWAINRFSVDGRSGLDIIGPYQGGGGGCCYSAPSRWQPGLTVRVDWETGVAYADGFPGFADRPKDLGVG